ncbi:hypothetical protein GCM10009133_14440 [Cocleimonas flava]|uniref:Serine aminopeptidase S33 family n=1 Tax=Cocleimonas flava TaxID=634765 RepID=A0A4R1F1N3_9GAMM|nr:lipase family protein [Cocleimonas flava]TCJ87813.1 serine aminopeptidase S33 family [Cocleimonas flava]
MIKGIRNESKSSLFSVMNRLIFIMVSSLFLVACGGGSSSSNDDDQEIPTDPARGEFKSISSKTANSITDIQTAINVAGGQNITVQYAVDTYKIEYMTVDSSGELILVSGMIAIPAKSSPSPIISYQHATTFTNDEAPSEQLTPSEKSIEIALASLGYIVFSADYIGFGSSLGVDHPYLQKDTSAYTVTDMLKASKTWLDTTSIQSNGQLFMTGYSQGGYVTMAALQDYQANPQQGMDVVTAVMGAGPYNLNLALNELVEENLGFSIPTINLPGDLADGIVSIIESAFIPQDADVGYETTFLDRFLENDRQDNVHDWKPNVPVTLFHGEDDETVPIISSESTLSTMLALGADIELIKCTAVPSGHKDCVPEYVELVVQIFGGLRND